MPLVAEGHILTVTEVVCRRALPFLEPERFSLARKIGKRSFHPVLDTNLYLPAKIHLSPKI